MSGVLAGRKLVVLRRQETLIGPRNNAPPAREHDERVRLKGLTPLQAVLLQGHVRQHLRLEVMGRIGAEVSSDTGEDLLCGTQSANRLSSLKDCDADTRTGKIEGGDEAVVTGADDDCGGHQVATPSKRPPSTRISVPVMYEASSEHRKQMRAATSSGVPSLLSGTVRATSSSRS